jgi:TonB family protein
MQSPRKVMQLLVLSVLAITPRTSAQNAFVVIEDGQSRLVKEIRHGSPQIDVDGKLQQSYGQQFGLTKAPFYRPGLVALPKFIVKTHHLNLNMAHSAGSLNYEMQIRASAKSDVPLENCFFVLELMSWKDTSFLFARMPNLEAGKEEDFDLSFKLQIPLEEGHYRVHIFSDGVELLHSRMPADYLAAQKQKSDDFLSGRKTEFDAVPAHKVQAVYPAELTASAMEGRVKVNCRINNRGQVASAEVVESNHPAFSEPALAAVRQWKFDPAVKDRQLVESTEIVTVLVKPPKPKR